MSPLSHAPQPMVPTQSSKSECWRHTTTVSQVGLLGVKMTDQGVLGNMFGEYQGTGSKTSGITLRDCVLAAPPGERTHMRPAAAPKPPASPRPSSRTPPRHAAKG